MKCPKCHKSEIHYHGFDNCAGACSDPSCNFSFYDPEKAERDFVVSADKLHDELFKLCVFASENQNLTSTEILGAVHGLVIRVTGLFFAGLNGGKK
jgi:hypothetical protein